MIGVDGCRAGWVAVHLDRGPARVTVHAGFAAIAALPAVAIGVDMPLGFVATGWRDADRALRDFLGPRRSTVFAMPPRAVIAAGDHEAACTACAAMTGKRISLQAFHLFPKLRELDRHIRDPRILEIHPETSFAVMAGGPLASSKKSAPGRRTRRRLLRAQGIVWPRAGPRGVAVDDLLDAAAVAWSARRHALGVSRQFPPEVTQHDACGRAIVVVA